MFLSAIAVEKTGYSGSAAEKRPVDHIRGQIEMSHIFFRYDENTPYVLNDLSLSIKAGEYVVFETLYEINPETGEEKIVAVHKDINDKSQTVKRPEPPKPPKGGRTGDDSHPFIWIAVLTAALAGAGILIVRRRKLM